MNKEELSFDDLKVITSHYFGEVNYESEKIVDYLNTLDKKFKNTQYYKKELSKLFNPSNKPIGSVLTTQYWINRGWSLEYANNKISEIQKKRSKLCKEYWIERGLSVEDALEEVVKIQKKLSQTSNKVFDTDYWIGNGYTEKEANALVREHSDNRSCRNPKFWQNRGLSPEESYQKAREINDNSSMNSLIRKHGSDKAATLYKEHKKRGRSGEQNAQYGKPSPKNSGNGISGYYKDYYFRSLSEYFAIKHFENTNTNFVCNDVAVSKNKNKVVIEYEYENKRKNYIPDFIIDNSIIIEIKNEYTKNTDVTKTKIRAAKEFISNNDKYTEIIVLTENDLDTSIEMCIQDYLSGLLIIDKNKKKRFQKRLGKLHEITC